MTQFFADTWANLTLDPVRDIPWEDLCPVQDGIATYGNMTRLFQSVPDLYIIAAESKDLYVLVIRLPD